MVFIQYPSNAEIKAGQNLPILTRLTFGASSKKALSSGVFYKCFSGIILSPSQEVESSRSLQTPTLCCIKDSCSGSEATWRCNRDEKRVHNFPKRCSNPLRKLQMGSLDILCLAHEGCYDILRMYLYISTTTKPRRHSTFSLQSVLLMTNPFCSDKPRTK